MYQQQDFSDELVLIYTLISELPLHISTVVMHRIRNYQCILRSWEEQNTTNFFQKFIEVSAVHVPLWSRLLELKFTEFKEYYIFLLSGIHNFHMLQNIYTITVTYSGTQRVSTFWSLHSIKNKTIVSLCSTPTTKKIIY